MESFMQLLARLVKKFYSMHHAINK